MLSARLSEICLVWPGSLQECPDTPVEETLTALVDIVRQGKALYIALSKWPREAEEAAYRFLDNQGCHCLLYQDRLNIFGRSSEQSGL